jgi:hypothetical protein
MAWVGRFDASYLWQRLQGRQVDTKKSSLEVRLMKSDFPNSGIMFVNDRQRPDSKDPDRKGSADITCPNCDKRFQTWISGWLKTGKSGAKFLSLSFKAKDKPAAAASTTDDGWDFES